MIEYFIIGLMLLATGYWLGYLTTKHPKEAEMFELIVEARAERERGVRRRDKLRKELDEAVIAELNKGAENGPKTN